MTPPVRPRRREIAREWMRAVYPTAYVPLSPAEIELFLLDLVDVIADAVQAEPFAVDAVAEVGGRLVRGHFTGQDTLRRTVDVLGRALLFAPELRGVPRLAEKVVAVLGGISAGFAGAMRLAAFDQQEEVKRALLTAKRRAERVLAVSEARFHEVFATSAFGIVITDLTGVCVEANEALGEMVGVPHAELGGRRLLGLFHPADADALAAMYRAAGAGRVDRFREQRRLVRADGEPVWVRLAVSLLRDADGRPAFHVTMAEDVTELHLLQKNLDHQLLHDALTGLSNRQHFATRLEAMHGASPGGVTLYHLDLDAFSVVNNGVGHPLGDRVLREVGRRLEAVVAREDALVARVGGDEFALVVANRPGTPTVPAMVERITAALAEPMTGGTAVSASIGVVDRPTADWGVDELLRAANATLHRAQARGKRQWLPYDRHEDTRARAWLARAARMPGALADGELEVEYRPVVDLESDAPVGHVARLRWAELEHEACVDLAEANGLSQALGQWALGEAAEAAAGWSAGTLHVELSPMQSRDEDLVGTVKRILDRTGLPGTGLRLFLDTRSMLAQDGDNAQVLRDNGIAVGLAGFNGGQAELSLLGELAADALLLAPSAVRRLAGQRESLPHRAIGAMVRTIRESGIAVFVPDVPTPELARWWRGVGVDGAFGAFTGPAVPGWEL
ncbi:diguanylate cyclase [Actinosynnema sp. NPDC047251]|uniref:Putative diguanylate cyclase/phosphodiesterase with PAS/PAC sensor domain(S) n=1 Tax=Saccharothrix espanaensis (strain ATCC 51144 / DSM 44229 / JCM 9112 / NBRC 15066 / NRRL 15764) TaxID=1179773 RepID=K0JSL8_SACES|nr:diguanylate cyclase [Saccharothrix espanaensis]CCH28876.1 putative diguanylate cyclase/phosphodiesterase with PAS/PAC sensor domain(s) [Saccharothrix espanaensis DSM 44229]